jgi:hypothetical protein
MKQALFLQHSIFFATYECTEYARLLHYTRLLRLVEEKHYSLLGPFISWEENKVL